MKNIINLFVLISLTTSSLFAQSIDEEFSKIKMKKDFEVFKNIRIKANSGLYKHRTKQEIDSIYNWAEKKIEDSNTYRDFYNIICQLSNFEGSVHNKISFPTRRLEVIRLEKDGYFPFPIKLIESKWVLNFNNEDIPLGSQIISINGRNMDEIIKNLYKYYETDGVNLTGKKIRIEYSFSRYYRRNYGLEKSFTVEYKIPNSNIISQKKLSSISYKEFATNVDNRYSKPFDILDYTNSNDLKEKYSYKKKDSETGILTINSFDIGNDKDSPEHLKFVSFLDSTFVKIKAQKIVNLIVDIRPNGGGTDPNELVVYEYLTQRNFSENKSAWVSFQKIPYLKHIETKVPFFLRFLGVIKYNKYFKKEFPVVNHGKFYQDSSSEDHKIRTPNKNAFKGNIYLLISPRVASSGSNFGSLVVSNDNTTIVGEETQGGYYGHNGHTPMSYILPNSKIITTFSVVNLEQDAVEKKNQIQHRGIIPDYNISQTYDDYLNHIDTQMNFVFDLIKSRQHQLIVN
jgi:C-terminal processing protease CtpA/Prc